MKTSKNNLRVFALLAVTVVMLMAPVAEAIVGRPGTPVSVAGVARRSVRRTTVVVASSASHANAQAQQQTAAANHAAAESAEAAQQSAAAAQQAAAAAEGTPALASLPAGCTPAGSDYNCGGVHYRAYFISGTLVYKQVTQ